MKTDTFTKESHHTVKYVIADQKETKLLTHHLYQKKYQHVTLTCYPTLWPVLIFHRSEPDTKQKTNIVTRILTATSI